jgi:CTP synthase
VKDKMALFCNVDKDSVITAKDVESIYEVPIILRKEGLDELIVRLLRLETGPPNLRDWDILVQKIKRPRHEVTIALVGKYVESRESYKSLSEALVHGGLQDETSIKIQWVESGEIEKNGPERLLADVDGVLIPGGFGIRGIEGKVETIRYVREKKIPFFGICLGMQCAVIEIARHLAGLGKANSAEFNPETPYAVIDLLPEQRSIQDKGGTMRLGAFPCKLVPETLASAAYGQSAIRERHRHRYEFNNDYLETLTSKGLIISGTSPDGKLVEIIELQGHPWFVGTQFHPEFHSRLCSPHPLFTAFIGAALQRKFGT